MRTASSSVGKSAATCFYERITIASGEVILEESRSLTTSRRNGIEIIRTRLGRPRRAGFGGGSSTEGQQRDVVVKDIRLDEGSSDLD